MLPERGHHSYVGTIILINFTRRSMSSTNTKQTSTKLCTVFVINQRMLEIYKTIITVGTLSVEVNHYCNDNTAERVEQNLL